MKLIFVVLCVLFFVSNVGADEVEMGPYLVSFDLGEAEHTIENWGASKIGGGYTDTTGESYSCYIDGDGCYGIISITDYDTGYAVSFLSQYTLFGADSAHVRTVDGHNATLFVRTDNRLDNSFNALYSLDGPGWVDADGLYLADEYIDQNAIFTGNTIVMITSHFDWNATRQLLNTIHVEKVL